MLWRDVVTYKGNKMESIKFDAIAERDEMVNLFKMLPEEQQNKMLELARSLLAQQDAITA